MKWIALLSLLPSVGIAAPLDLTATVLRPGEIGSLMVDGDGEALAEGIAVWFMQGNSEAPGPCPGYLDGGCWDIESPHFVQVAFVDAGGVATLTRTLDAGISIGTMASFQAATNDGGIRISNPLTVTVVGAGGDCPQSCQLTGAPDPSTVFNTGDVTYFFSNNLVGMVWHAESDQILGGHYSNSGYYSFTSHTGGYSELPDNDVGTQYGRMILAANTGVVVRNNSNQFATPAATHTVGTIDPVTGALSGFVPAVYSDGFGGNCNLISASATEFLCFDGATIRHYGTEFGSGNLTLNATVALLAPLPVDLCEAHCFGGQFAWDGEYYYLPEDGNSPSNLTYQVYDAAGTNVGTHTATGSGAMTSLYFDWSTCRYGSHDGFGGRSLGAEYWWAGGSPTNDSSTFGFPSTDHDVVDYCL
jgi:hypothetical protein